jgi:hypothetical protein
MSSGRGGAYITPSFRLWILRDFLAQFLSFHNSEMKFLSLGCLDVVSIETLDLDTAKRLVSTIEKILTLSKS